MTTNRAIVENALCDSAGRDVHAGKPKVRILLAEEQPLIRAAISALLRSQPDFDVVAEVDRGDRVLDAARLCAPDLAVLEIQLPGLDGLRCADQLIRQVPGCRILILTGLARPGYLRHAAALHVSGFLLKGVEAEQLFRAVRAVAAGQDAFDHDLAMAAMRIGDNPLSHRERQVLSLTALGSSVEGIARELCLSTGTVRNLVSTAIQKLHSRNRLDASRTAEETGWLPPRVRDESHAQFMRFRTGSGRSSQVA